MSTMPTYVLTDYGVIADCDALQTEAVQKVFDMCREGGGTVVVPKGSFIVAGLRMWSNTTLYLQAGAELYGSTDCESYEVFPIPEGMEIKLSDKDIIHPAFKDFKK